MKEYLVEFGSQGRLIWRVAKGHNRGDARINARMNHWAEFKKSVFKED